MIFVFGFNSIIFVYEHLFFLIDCNSSRSRVDFRPHVSLGDLHFMAHMENHGWVGEMAQQVRVLASKPGDLSLILGTHMIKKKKKRFLQIAI